MARWSGEGGSQPVQGDALFPEHAKIEEKTDTLQTNKNKIVFVNPESPIQISGNTTNTTKNDNVKVILYTEKQLSNFNFFKRTILKLNTYSNFFDRSKTTYPPKILDTLKHDNTKWNRFLLKKNL